MRIAESFAVIAGDDHQRVIVEMTRPQGVEETPEMPICLSHSIQIAIKQLAMRCVLFINKMDRLCVVSQCVWMMRLIRPDQREKRAIGAGIDPLDQAVHKNSVLGAPGACHASAQF